MIGIIQDLRYASRTLIRAPGFTAVAVATIALGIGGSTAIFSVVDAVLLRPLSFAEPQRLTMIRPTSGSRLSPGYLHDWRLESRAFDDMTGWYDVRVNLTGGGEPLEVLADRVTANFFSVLGTPAFLGRTFTVGADLRDVASEVVLSHGFWQRHYGGDPRVLGQSVRLDGESFIIIGVMPDGFTIRTTELAESRAELWIPFSLVPGDRIGMGGALNVVARLAPDATAEQARAELSSIAQRIEEQYPSYSRNWRVQVVPLHDATVQDVRLALSVLFAAVGILLLIACANVANLVLNRTARRQAELAIRRSLGATVARLVRQLLTEAFVLAGAGGAVGVLLAKWALDVLIPILPAGLELPRARDVDIDIRVLGFAFLVTILTAILFGLVPSLISARSAPQSALRDVTRGSSLSRHWNRLAAALIISQLSLAVALLASAGLLGRSFWALSRVNPGFRAEQVLTLRTTLPASKYETDDRVGAFGGALLERIENLPGVSRVGSVGYLPMSRFGAAAVFEIEGRPEVRSEDLPGSWISVVGGRYFDVMGIPLIRGRLFSDADTRNTEPVFVIDEQLARRYWPDQDPIGTRITWPKGLQQVISGVDAGDDEVANESEPLSGAVVGVVGSVRWGGMAVAPPATAYWWFPQVPARQLTIVTRTVGDPMAMAAAITNQVREIDPNQPVAEVRAMRELVSADLAQPRFTMLLVGSFAALALLLAAIGLYGVMAFGVTARAREIGVRMALGAQYTDVLRPIMQRGMLLTGIGVVIGIALALALGHLMSGLLYGVTPRDPITLMGVAVFLACVALLATYLPARRATELDPIVALKYE
jgi:predicted permease